MPVVVVEVCQADESTRLDSNFAAVHSSAYYKSNRDIMAATKSQHTQADK
jgi:hypothetical protein